MLPIFTAKEMREIDAQLIEKVGIPSLVLMENAARGAVGIIEEWIENGARDEIHIFAGTGNNGGDGLALARLLLERGHTVHLYIVGEESKFSQDAQKQHQILQNLQYPFKPFTSEKSVTIALDAIVVDALLGTGSSGALREPVKSAVQVINNLRTSHQAKVLALDIPTGLDADHGCYESDSLIVHADITVTMGARKQGFYQGDSKVFTGQVRVSPLGAPIKNTHLEASQRVHLVVREDIVKAYPSRSDTASKFTLGRVFALCGSRGMTGAAIMAATSAIKSGCGLVNVAVPASERSLVAQAMPELLTVGCAETDLGMPSIRGWKDLEEHIERADAILVGSGLRPWEEVTELMLKIIREVDKPMIVDAGALGALVGNLHLLKKRKAPTILTPHSGELARMVEKPWQEVDRDRFRTARQFAMEHEVVVVMKGAPTYTIDRTGEVFVNSTGNSGLATAGSGDVLAGILAGTFVQISDRPRDAAMIGTYVHGLAGDIASRYLTTIAMTATDIIKYLPSAYRELGVDNRYV